MKKLLFVFALLFCIQNAKSQEIKATVQCVAPRVQISDKQILTTLQNSIQQFITTRRWTEEKIETNEKIEILNNNIYDYKNVIHTKNLTL
jgi:hypothetical protein